MMCYIKNKGYNENKDAGKVFTHGINKGLNECLRVLFLVAGGVEGWMEYGKICNFAV